MNSEQFSGEYLERKLGLRAEEYEPYEDNFRNNKQSKYKALHQVADLENFHTPDYIISNNVDDTLEDLLFVDVSGPQGGLLRETGIEVDKEIKSKTSDMYTGETCSIILTKQHKKLLSGVKSKLIKINNKYANDRDKHGSHSSNTGLIYCLDEIAELGLSPHDFSYDLASYQLSITTLEILDFLSEGRCQYTDIEFSGLNRPVVFSFSKKFPNISFVIFIGRRRLANRSYIFVNRDFFEQSRNVLADKLRTMSIVNGDAFREHRCAKSKIAIDIHQSAITEEDPYVFPYGDVNYIGSDNFPGTDIPLTTLSDKEYEKIRQKFDEGINRYKDRTGK